MASIEINRVMAPECPRCGTEWPEGDYWPSLSRQDNETEICSDCGNSEALIDYYSRDGLLATPDILGWHNQTVVRHILLKKIKEAKNA
jgi:ribosomal protein S27AE